jgi:hypothetical protein
MSEAGAGVGEARASVRNTAQLTVRILKTFIAELLSLTAD